MISTFFPEQEQLFKERTGKDFTFFYKKYYPKLIYFTSQMCKDPQKAEDISTDSFLIASKKTMSLDVEIDEEGTTMKDFLQEEESDEFLHDIVTKKSEILKDHIIN